MSGEGGSLGGLMTQVYKDLGQPAARIVGQSLGEIVGFVLVPLGKCASIGRNILPDDGGAFNLKIAETGT